MSRRSRCNASYAGISDRNLRTCQLGAHESLGVVGESGSGKTVLSRTIMGLQPRRGVGVTGSVLLNGIEPFAYLCDVLEKLPTWPNKKLHELLPWNWKKSALA